MHRLAEQTGISGRVSGEAASDGTDTGFHTGRNHTDELFEIHRQLGAWNLSLESDVRRSRIFSWGCRIYVFCLGGMTDENCNDDK